VDCLGNTFSVFFYSALLFVDSLRWEIEMSCDKCGSATHRDDAMNVRCNGCEHLIRQCICKDKENAMPNFEMKDGIEIQRVWRTLSENKNSTGGFYVWDILEYMSDKDPESYIIDSFVQCRDGSWVMAECYHNWTRDQGEKNLHAEGAFYQNIIVIPETHQCHRDEDNCGLHM
jgi:hypothetical protein